MATTTSVVGSITAIGVVVGGAFAAGYYLGEKHLSEAEARLESFKDAQTLPLASVVKEAEGVLGELADRLELMKLVEDRNSTIISIENELEHLREETKNLTSESVLLEQSISQLQELLLPVEIAKEIHLSGNRQEILPASGKLIGLNETLFNDYIAFSLDGVEHVLNKGTSVNFQHGGLSCIVSPLDWNCCSPREAVFHYQCKRPD